MQDCCELAFGQVGLDWKKYVKHDTRFERPAEVETLLADPTKAKTRLGWVPRVDFPTLMRMMVDADPRAPVEEVVTVLVTGANGFVGRWVIRALLAAGHTVVGATGPETGRAGAGLDEAERTRVQWMPLDLLDAASVVKLAGGNYDAVLHLAGLASGGDAARDPGVAWTVNAAGTARLLDALGGAARRGASIPWSWWCRARRCTSAPRTHWSRPTRSSPARPTRPPSGAPSSRQPRPRDEPGCGSCWRVPFPTPGRGRTPASSRRHSPGGSWPRARVACTRCTSATSRSRGTSWTSGTWRRPTCRCWSGAPRARPTTSRRANGITLRDVFDRLARIVGVEAIPETDPAFVRSADLMYLVGDAGKLCRATGWTPSIPFETTLRDLVHAQAN